MDSPPGGLLGDTGRRASVAGSSERIAGSEVALDDLSEPLQVVPENVL